MEKNNLLAHTIINVDPQAVVQNVLEFCKDLPDPEIMYSTTAIIVGSKASTLLVAGKPTQTPIINTITSCLILWYGTKKDREQWEIDRIKIQAKFMQDQMK